MQYMVIELRKNFAILLSEKGEFVRAANMNYQLGQKVLNPVLMSEKKSSRLDSLLFTFGNRRNRGRMRLATAILSLVMVFGLLLGTGLFYRSNYLVAYSSVVLQINPQVEMDLNRQGSVLELKGLNPEGQALLKGYKPADKDKNLVVKDLIERAIQMGFLQDGGKVTLAINADEETYKRYEIDFSDYLNKALDRKLRYEIGIENYEQWQNSTEPYETMKYRYEIPIDWDDSDYDGESDYDGDSDYAGSSDYDGESDYNDGHSDYDDSSYNDDSDYDDSSYNDDSDYDDGF